MMRQRSLPALRLLQRLRLWALILPCALLVIACTPLPLATHAAPSESGPWSGRLSLIIDSERSEHFYAGFTLEGNAQSGRLDLTTPIGTTLARLEWDGDHAELTQGGRTQQFSSLEAMTSRLTGAPLPLAALFDWLKGQNTAIEGWSAHLESLNEGKLSADRQSPQPQAHLRMVLDN